MKRRGAPLLPLGLLLTALSATAPAVAATPSPPPTAFPGDTGRFATVSGPCPTFLWGAVPGADRYELAVYSFGEDGRVDDQPSLFQSLPGSVNGWTPEGGRCPEAGGRHAWAVRAFVDGDPTEWSDGRLFELSDLPSVEELEEALEVLRRYTGEGQESPESAEAPATPPVPVPQTQRARLGSGLMERLKKRLGERAEEADARIGRKKDGKNEHREERGAAVERLRLEALRDALDPMREALRTDALQAESISPRTVTFPTDYSLGLEGDLVIEGGIFQEGRALLHTDGGFDSSNTALGLDALVSATPNVPTSGDGELNTAVGRSALRNNSSGPGNTAVGAAALYSNTGGELNTAVGALALPFNTTGYYNTATGAGALYSNTTGSNNTATGNRALRDNSTGFNNTATGREALRNNETGVDNTAAGSFALATNFTGDFNTALGAWALTENTAGSRNTASGAFALESNTIGVLNTATGYAALENNTTGRGNTASGAAALFSNTTGSTNTATGANALESNTTGFSNHASGANALESNTTGFSNHASGYAALGDNTEGHTNTATGALALGYNTTGVSNTANGFAALASNTEDTGNTAIGFLALSNLIQGDGNIALGNQSGLNLESGHSNIYLFNAGIANESGTVRVGLAGVQTAVFVAGIRGATVGSGLQVLVGAQGRLGTTTSSRRFKEEIEDMGDASAPLLALRPVTFRYTEQAAGDGPRPIDFGLIAEEVAELYPDLVAYDEDGKPYAVRYHMLPAMLLNELQRQDERLRAHERRIEALRDELRRLRGRGDPPVAATDPMTLFPPVLRLE